MSVDVRGPLKRPASSSSGLGSTGRTGALVKGLQGVVRPPKVWAFVSCTLGVQGRLISMIHRALDSNYILPLAFQRIDRRRLK